MEAVARKKVETKEELIANVIAEVRRIVGQVKYETDQQWVFLPHYDPHMDERLLAFILSMFGEKMFPGISEAEESVSDSLAEEYRGLSFEQLLAKRVFPLGWGGGPDDHLLGKEKVTCSAELGAHLLGVQDHPALQRLLTFTLSSDTEAKGHRLDLARLMKTVNRSFKGNNGPIISALAGRTYWWINFVYEREGGDLPEEEPEPASENEWVFSPVRIPGCSEFAAMALIQHCCQHEFAGIRDHLPRVVLMDDLPKEVQALSEQELLQRKIIPLGWGNGRFHGNGDSRLLAESIADGLGVRKNPEWDMILNFGRSHLNRDEHNPLHLARLVMLYNEKRVSQDRGFIPNLVHQVSWWLNSLFYQDLSFHVTCPAIFRQAKQYRIRAGGEKRVKVCFLHTDNENAHRYAASRWGGHQDIIVQRLPSGRCMIFSRQKSQFQMNQMFLDFARVIRFTEQLLAAKEQGLVVRTLGVEDIRYFMEGKGVCTQMVHPDQPRGIAPFTSSWKLLEWPGSLPTVPEWYFLKKGNMLLNGSKTRLEETPPTRISDKLLKELIEIVVNPDKWPASQAKWCRKGRCQHREVACPWWRLGLFRCRDNRKPKTGSMK